MSDQLIAETSTWQHTTLTIDKHPCPSGIRTHDPSRRAAADLRLRPRSHWDQHTHTHTHTYIYIYIYIYVIYRKGGTHILPDNHWWPLTAFLLRILDNVSSSGSSTGIAASSHRGSTMKGTEVSTPMNILHARTHARTHTRARAHTHTHTHTHTYCVCLLLCSHLTPPPFKFQSSADHYGHLIPATKG